MLYLCSKNKGAVVTLQLICAIVFAYAYAKIRFSHDMAQLLTIPNKDLNTTASAIIIQQIIHKQVASQQLQCQFDILYALHSDYINHPDPSCQFI